MPSHIATVCLLVRDYDEALKFFVDALRFRCLEDVAQGASRRWVVVAPEQQPGAALLLAKADSDESLARVGNQAGDHVFMILQTRDFRADYAHMKAQGVQFLEPAPRLEPYGTVIVFQDLYGNRWDLLERA